MRSLLLLLLLALGGCNLELAACPEPEAPVCPEPEPVPECPPPPELSECVQREAFTWECSGTNVCAAYPGLLSVTLTVECAP